jgi:hypothetical protein
MWVNGLAVNKRFAFSEKEAMVEQNMWFWSVYHVFCFCGIAILNPYLSKPNDERIVLYDFEKFR